MTTCSRYFSPKCDCPDILCAILEEMLVLLYPYKVQFFREALKRFSNVPSGALILVHVRPSGRLAPLSTEVQTQ